MTASILPATAAAPVAANVRRLNVGWTLATVGIAVLVSAVSLLGLFASWPYAAETADWRMQANGQDLGNLVAVATLVAGGATAARGSLRGLMVWAGSLLFLAYGFVIYAMTVHFGPLFPAYVTVLGLSVYAFAFGLRWWDGGVQIARGARTLGAAVIASIAALFAVLWLSQIVPAVLSGQVPLELTRTGLTANPVHVLDLALVLPGMLVTARLARKGRGPAQVLLGPWLVFAALMGTSVAITLALGGAMPPAVVVGLITAITAVAAGRVLRATSPALTPGVEPAAAGSLATR